MKISEISDYIKKIENAAKILGLGYYASINEIKKRYHELAKQHHPDVSESKEFIKIKEAYELLIDFCQNFKVPLTEEKIREFKKSVEQIFKNFLDNWWFGS